MDLVRNREGRRHAWGRRVGGDRVTGQTRPDLRGSGAAHAAIVLVLLATAPYVNGLSNEFVYDDIAQVVRNGLVRSIDPRPTFEFGAVTHGRVEWYRPLTVYTFALNYAVSGLAPFSYHAVNVGLHAANTLLVFSIGRSLLASLPAAAAAAALFGVHAVHTEAVSPVFGRADLLAALFVLLAWRLAIESREVSRSRTAAITLLFVAGLLSKENASAFMPALVFTDIALHVRPRTLGRDLRQLLSQRWRLYAALVLAAAGYLALRYAIAGGVFAAGSHVRYVENPLTDAELAVRIFTALWVALKYVGLFILPYPLSADYSYNQIPLIRTAADPRAMAVVALLAGAVGLLVWLERRVPRTVLLAGVFALLLLPVSNLIVPVGTIMAERMLYLPSVALCLLAGLWFARIYGLAGSRMKIVITALFVGVLGVHAAATVARNRDWTSEERLFAATVRASPASAKARFNYATALFESGQPAVARAMLESAVTIAPAYPEAHNLLGTLALSAEDLDTARVSFEAALRDSPEYPPALANLGTVRRREGRLAEARQLLERAIAADASMAVAHVNLGLVAELQGDYQVALEHYRRAYALDSSLDVARQRADALDRRGRS